jgi:hypothetical protein
LEPVWVCCGWRTPDINKLCNVASCWIYIRILLGAHPFLHISSIRVNHWVGGLHSADWHFEVVIKCRCVSLPPFISMSAVSLFYPPSPPPYKSALQNVSCLSCFRRLIVLCGCFICCRWRGSIYKLVWPDLSMFLLLYYTLNFIYRFFLDSHQKK